MKINKKLKYTFISSLTLIASTISVVACGNKNKTYNKNYNNFLIPLKKNLKDPDKQKDFFQNNSSFSLLKNYNFHGGIKQKDVTLSIAKDIEPENTYIFDSAHQIKLSDLKYGGIKIDDKDKKFISFTKNNITIKLDDAFFVSKFDISVEYKEAFTTTKKLNYNLTSFFQLENTKEGKLENTKEGINLNFKAFKNIDLSNAKPSVDGFNRDNIKFKFDSVKEKKDPLLGLKNNNKVLGANPSKIAPGEDFAWGETFTLNSKFYCNVDFGNPDSLKFDDNKISFTYDSLLVNGSLQGTDKKLKNFNSDFYFIEDLKKLNEDKSFTVSIDTIDPLAVIFSK